VNELHRLAGGLFGPPTVDVWIAHGLRRRYRVVSIGVTYGEFDELDEAERFIELLVLGNPDLARLR
jgi:hypothetical protein